VIRGIAGGGGGGSGSGSSGSKVVVHKTFMKQNSHSEIRSEQRKMW
jgi:hypothetical protein